MKRHDGFARQDKRRHTHNHKDSRQNCKGNNSRQQDKIATYDNHKERHIARHNKIITRQNKIIARQDNTNEDEQRHETNTTSQNTAYKKGQDKPQKRQGVWLY